MSKESKDAKEGKETKEEGPFVVDNGGELGRNLLRFCLDGKTADFTFVVGPKAVEVPVHKLVVGAWSDTLRRLVQLDNASESKAVLPQHDPEMFKAFMRYLYSGQANISKDNLGGLLDLAHEYEVPSLVDACLSFMGKELTVDNACQLAAVAHKYNHRRLYEKYLKFIFMNAPFVLKSPGFLDLSEPVLAELLASDNLAASEVDIFTALLRWADAREGGKERLPELLKHIRWARLSLKDFMKVVRPTGVVPEEKLLVLMEYAADPDEPPASKYVEEWISRPRRPPAHHCPPTSRFTDNTGIFYWLGTNGGKTSFSNPFPAHVMFTLSTSGGDAIRNLSDRNVASGAVENRYGAEANPWLEIEFLKHKVQLESYFIAQEQDHYLRNWRLEAWDEKEHKWITVREHVNDTSLSHSNRQVFFPAMTVGFHRRFRLYVTGPSHTGAPNFDITELEMFGYIAPLAEEELSKAA